MWVEANAVAGGSVTSSRLHTTKAVQDEPGKLAYTEDDVYTGGVCPWS